MNKWRGDGSEGEEKLCLLPFSGSVTEDEDLHQLDLKVPRRTSQDPEPSQQRERRSSGCAVC